MQNHGIDTRPGLNTKTIRPRPDIQRPKPPKRGLERLYDEDLVQTDWLKDNIPSSIIDGLTWCDKNGRQFRRITVKFGLNVIFKVFGEIMNFRPQLVRHRMMREIFGFLCRLIKLTGRGDVINSPWRHYVGENDVSSTSCQMSAITRIAVDDVINLHSGWILITGPAASCVKKVGGGPQEVAFFRQTAANFRQQN